MAQATIPHATPTRLSSKRKPDPARVVQSFYHIVATQGKRGALRKTGDIYGISDESVRRYVAAHEAAQNTPDEPEDLAYAPPPGGYAPPVVPFVSTPEAEPDADDVPQSAQTGADYVAPNATDEPHNEDADYDTFMSSGNATNEAGSQDSVIATDDMPQAEIATRHIAEREIDAVAPPQMPQRIIYRERAAPPRQRWGVTSSAASYNPIASDGEVLWVVARAAIFVALVVVAMSVFS